ncbi:MAG: helix-turn-helix transcriptional regulator [Phycisphaerae bacterium]|nr:helix-turn-helix transcriptional regulator [Phycisphaerae bacterium]
MAPSANTILARRLALELTQPEAADAAGISQPLWSKVENRETLDDTRFGTVRAIAAALGCTTDDLASPPHNRKNRRLRT